MKTAFVASVHAHCLNPQMFCPYINEQQRKSMNLYIVYQFMHVHQQNIVLRKQVTTSTIQLQHHPSQK